MCFLSDRWISQLFDILLGSESPAYYAHLYRKHGLEGGHIIKLGKGNDEAARDALNAWPGGLQIGGGITEANALEWLDAGASKVPASTS